MQAREHQLGNILPFLVPIATCVSPIALIYICIGRVSVTRSSAASPGVECWT